MKHKCPREQLLHVLMLVREDCRIVVVRFRNLDSFVLDTREDTTAIAHETTSILGGDGKF